MNIYEGNRNSWDFLIIKLIDIPFSFERQCNYNSHEGWKELIDKYEVSDEKQEILNEVTKRWNNYSIKDTSQEPYKCFNKLFDLNLKFKNIKVKYDKDEDEMKAHVFDVLPK